MIRHIVLFKFRDDASATAAEGKRRLEGLVGSVSQIQHLEAGVNVVASPRAHDLALTVTFDSIAELEAYRVDPAHETVGAWLRDRAASIVSCDYEL